MMALRVLASFALIQLHVNTVDALTMREVGPGYPMALTEGEVEIPPTNQAVHIRPTQRHHYRKLRDTEEENEKLEHIKTYNKINDALSRSRNMTHSREILQYVMSQPHAPTLPAGGCLYLPNNAAWISFYQTIEHPYPPLFMEMVANSYYPDCNATSLTGVWLPSSCGADRMWGSKGCFKVSRLTRTANIEVYETMGHIGLPDKWARHIDAVKPRQHRLSTRGMENSSHQYFCGKSSTLPAIDAKQRLEIPTVYVVCRTSDDDNRITRRMVEEQNRWANEAYKGRSPWERMSFDAGQPEAADMQISFKLVDVNFVTDRTCAKYGFTQTQLVNKYNINPLEHFTVVVLTDDQSGVLGQTEFPFDVPEASPEWVVMVSAEGFRHYPSTNDGDLSYDEGDTVVHETGHGLGLYHTFESGCGSWAKGDLVDDTVPEALPHYSCAASSSCGQADPVHNFMDYTPDQCMVGFTEGQKRRAWCIMRRFRPTLFGKSLKTAAGSRSVGVPAGSRPRRAQG